MSIKGSGRRADFIGFTLVELLSVIAIVLLLATLLIPTISLVMERARSIGCRANMKSLQTGFNLQTMEQGGLLASGSTTWPNGYGAKPWAEAQDFTSTNSAIWPYVQETRAYMCPSYPSPGREKLKRHYSVSGFINSEGAYWGAKYSARAMSQVRAPSKTHVMIEEYDQRSQNGGFGLNPGCQGSFVVGYGPGSYLNNWVDTPMFWHEFGAYFTFLDGHAEYRRWVGPRMRTVNIYTWQHVSEGANWPANAQDAVDFFDMTDGVTNGYVY